MNSFFETGRKAARKERQLGPFVRGLRTPFNAALVAGILAAVSVFGLYLIVIDRHEESLSRSRPRLVQDSYVYDRDGNRIGTFRAGESRETVGFEGMGQHLPNAVVAVEDRRFYGHFGVDFEGPGRAAWADPRSWETREGVRAPSVERRRPLRVVYRTEYDPRDPSFLRGEL